MSASDFLRRHGWQMRANHWEHPKFPDVLHHVEQALLQQGEWLEQEREVSEAAMGLLKQFGAGERPYEALALFLARHSGSSR